MDLKQLKAALDASVLALEASPEDAALKAAHAEAKSAYDTALVAADEGDADDEDAEKLDVSKLPASAQKLIKQLRKENGDNRTKYKNLNENHGKLKQALVEAGIIEDEEGDPQEKLKTVTQKNEAATFDNAILEAALDHGVSKADLKYFKFLIAEAVEELEEGAELSEEALTELATQAKRKAPGGAGGSTSVNDRGAGKKPGATGDVTLDQFVKMSMGEKAALYNKSPEIYSAFLSEAKSKKLLI